MTSSQDTAVNFFRILQEYVLCAITHSVAFYVSFVCEVLARCEYYELCESLISFKVKLVFIDTFVKAELPFIVLVTWKRWSISDGQLLFRQFHCSSTVCQICMTVLAPVIPVLW